MRSVAGISVVNQRPVENIPSKRTLYSTEYVRSMFDAISQRYDLLNHLLSAGLDILWRRKLISTLGQFHPKFVLDLASGTADVAIEAAQQLHPVKVVGIDIAARMLNIGRTKVQRRGFTEKIELKLGNAEQLQFAAATFDCVTVAFGVRNFQNLEMAIKEVHRVLRSGGVFGILEFSRPTVFPVKQLYLLYSHTILPFIGRIISSNRLAYAYLPSTIAEFPDGDGFRSILASNGFANVKETRLAFGIATIYLAEK
jgi:demethylmenaquinone methyltransferase/2-methoxy-6-polyprenyl-1,4-benzoquinol methylase